MQAFEQETVPLRAEGATSLRLRRLVEVGREDLSLAKLAEAHWDAVAILAETGREAERGAVYGVWASAIPGEGLRLAGRGETLTLSGSKPFCSGLGIVDRALVTVHQPEPLLLDVDMRIHPGALSIDLSSWATKAFAATNTGSITFQDFPATREDIVGAPNFYLERPGFWHGACGPAACWVGGAAGLVSLGKKSKRCDPHTVAHLGAMDATLWSLEAALRQAGREIDAQEGSDPMLLALRLRHVVEQGCTEILHRFARAYGPHPLAMDAGVSRRYQELDLYLRQTHGERDLEVLGQRLLLKT